MLRTILSLFRQREGQSMLEAAFLLPFLIVLTFNAVNTGYFFFVYLNMATASRIGVEYSIQGSSSFWQNSLVSADTVHTLMNNDLSGAITTANNTPMRVCTLANGVTNPETPNQVPVCSTYGAGTYTTIQPDPEAPYLVLNRVDIQYTVSPLIGGGAFNLIIPASLNFHRYVYMRAEN